MIAKRLLFGAIAVACCASAAAGPATAQAYPNRPIRLIVPSPAGGSRDAAARLVGEHVSRAFGQQVVVEKQIRCQRQHRHRGRRQERSGRLHGSGHIRSRGERAACLQVERQSYEGFDPGRSGVASAGRARGSSFARRGLARRIHDVSARQRPGLSYATVGRWRQQHSVAEWFAKIAGIRLELVPYRGGEQAINDLIAGHVKIGSLG